MLVNRSPEVVQLAANADKHLIEKPLVTGLRPALPEALCVGPSEAQAPLADGLVADHDAPSGQDQFDLPQAQAEAVIQPNGLVDDFRRKTEAAVGVGCRAHARDPAIHSDCRQLDSTHGAYPGVPKQVQSA